MFRHDNKPPAASGNDLHIVFQKGQLLSDMRSPDLCLIELAQVQESGWREVQRQFLGYWGERPCYALEIDEIEAAMRRA